MHIRAPTLAELPLLSHWYAVHLGQGTDVTHLKAAVASSRDILQVAVEDQEVCGFFHAVWSGGPFELLALVVAPHRRNQGVGRLCLQHLLQLVSQTSDAELWLEVRSDNFNAHHLYLETGAMETGRRVNYYGKGLDAILMTYSASVLASVVTAGDASGG